MGQDFDQYRDVCKGKLDELLALARKTDADIRGNGKPGINVRLSSVESFQRTLSKLMWIVVVVVAGLVIKDVWPEKNNPEPPAPVVERVVP